MGTLFHALNVIKNGTRDIRMGYRILPKMIMMTEGIKMTFKEKYKELYDMVTGEVGYDFDTTNWTHEEAKERLALQVDAFYFRETLKQDYGYYWEKNNE